ncbi:hypothetical protein ACHAXR_009363 [Thalassiosira sp. AJA248-18]
MTVEHALSCKVGGLVHIRHDDVADEFRHLCGTALSFGRVEREPRIFSSTCRGGEATTAADGANLSHNNPASDDDEQPSATAERGDASCHGFWKRGCTCIFHVRITDTDVCSQLNKDVSKILAKHEKEKKDKYLRSCHEMRKDFTPLVYSVDGIAGREAKNAERRIATILSDKWQRPYYEMVQYMRVRMAIAVVRANSLLIRGSRVRQRPRRPLIAGAAMTVGLADLAR